MRSSRAALSKTHKLTLHSLFIRPANKLIAKSSAISIRTHAAMSQLSNGAAINKMSTPARLIPCLVPTGPGDGIDFLTQENLVAAAVMRPTDGELKALPLSGGDSQDNVAMLITSKTQLTKQFDFSSDISAQYGKIEGRLQISNKILDFFQEESSFLLIKADVVKTYKGYDPLFDENLINYVNSDPKKFRKHYGDGYVRGLISGGYMCLAINITSSDKSLQSTTALSLKASANMPGLFNGKAHVNFCDQLAKVSKDVNIDIRSIFRGGSAGGAVADKKLVSSLEIKEEKNVDELKETMAEFARQIAENPRGLFAFIAPYASAKFPADRRVPPSFVEIDEYEDALKQYNKMLDRYISLRDGVVDVKKNKHLYFNPPSTEILNKWGRYLSDKINALEKQVQQWWVMR